MKEQLRIMKALADENRLRILKLIERRPLCVCELQEVLGIVQSAVSRHLKILEDAGLIARRKAGVWVEFYIETDAQFSGVEAILAEVLASLDGDPNTLSDRQAAAGVHREIVCASRREPQQAEASL